MIVSYAWAEDVNEGEALVLEAQFDQLGQVTLLAAEPAGNEGGAGGEGERDGIDWRLDISEGRALGLHAQLAGGRGLARSQSVNLVVHREVE